MNIKKLFAGLAAASIATTMSLSSAAVLVTVDDHDPGLSSATSMWLVQLYNVGSPEENKPATDYGINYADVAKIVVDVKAIEPEYIDGGLGGAVIWSNNGGDITSGTALWDTYNWPGTWNYWGIVDDDLEISTQDSTAGVLATKIGDYTYELVADVYDANPLHNGDASSIGCMQTGIQYWGNDMSDYEVLSLKALDKSGTVLLEFDGAGKLIGGTGAASAPAPVAAGDVAAATDSSKGSPDTGIEDVAVVAGLAAVAAGAFVVAKKRK